MKTTCILLCFFLHLVVPEVGNAQMNLNGALVSLTDLNTDPSKIDSLETAPAAEQNSDALTISGYLETYYSYDFGKPGNHMKPSFFYSFSRHNEVNLNFGYIKLAYNKSNVRGNLALMTGVYANTNLAAEPGVLKNIYEANAGIKISRSKNVWLDAGIFSSHIGFESAIGKDCWNLTRSLSAENSPYYESGVKISYTSNNEKWMLSGLILNGWQRIQRVDGNNLPAFGHQLVYKPSSKITLNSSSFVGSDTPDSSSLMRYFHDFYGIFQIHEKFGLTIGFDNGLQQTSKGSSEYNTWFSPVIITKYAATDNLSIALRGEFYNDKDEVIVYTGSENGFQTADLSLNLDYLISENAVWRIEFRGLSSKDEIFILNDEPSNMNYFATTSLAISL